MPRLIYTDDEYKIPYYIPSEDDNVLPVDNNSNNSWAASNPVPLQNPDASPADIAAFRTAQSVKRNNPLPVQDDRSALNQYFGPNNPERPSYIMEPDLQETQGGMHLPPSISQDASGALVYNDTGELVPLVRRPGVLPIAMTPEGVKFATPKLLDIVGNVMGNVGAPLKAAKGEMVLGSGVVRTGKELKHTPRNSGADTQIVNYKNIDDVPVEWLKTLPGNELRSEKKVLDLMEDIQQNGLKEPLIINVGKKSGTAKLGEGNHRLEAISRLGYDTAPTRVIVGQEYGKEFLPKSNFANDLIPKADEYFISDAKPSQVFKTLKSDTKPQVASQVGHQIEKNGFYSSLQTAVANAKPSTATAEQWLGYLRNQPGVKAEEINYVLKDLPEGQITKTKLEDIVKQNKVELKEKVLGGGEKKKFGTPEEQSAILKRYEDAKQALLDNKVGTKAYEKAKEEWEAIQRDIKDVVPGWGRSEGNGEFYTGPTKYSQYQLPGGENYKELLLSLPEKTVPADRWVLNYINEKGKNGSLVYNTKTEAEEAMKAGKKSGVKNTNYEIKQDVLKDIENNFQAPHFDEHGTNLLAHVRMNDRYLDNLNYVGPRKLTDTDFKRYKELGNLISKGLDEGKDVKNLMNEQNKIGALIEGQKISTGKEGKIKTLHIEELQSDWHQKGRKEGYKLSKTDQDKLLVNASNVDDKLIASNRDDIMGNPDLKAGLDQAVKDKIITQNEANDYIRLNANERSTIPDAPFKKTWDELALKRIIRHAAENGYEGISWTPGEAQAARYDLSKQINEISIHPRTDAKTGEQTRSILIKTPNQHLSVGINKEGIIDNTGASNTEWKGKKLDEVLGKEVAEKIMKTEFPKRPTELPEGYELIKDGNKWGVTPPGQTHARSLVGLHDTKEEALRQTFNHIHSTETQKGKILEGLDLKIGGEGMKAFYDKMLVDKANGLIKKYGSKVELNKELPFSNYTGKEAERMGLNSSEVQKNHKVHYFPLTPQLKQKAMQEGFSLFSSTPIMVPVDHNPFERKEPKLVPVSHIPVFE